MPAPIAFFRSILRSLFDSASEVEGGGQFHEMPRRAGAVWDAWSRTSTAADRRVELLSLARAPAGAIPPLAKQIVTETVADRPPEIRARLETVLTLIPRLIRQWLRQTEDPRGLSMAPNQSPFHANDLLPLLPVRLPRFKLGDRPIPGAARELVELLGVGRLGSTWLARDPAAATTPPVVLKFYEDPALYGRLRSPETAVILDVLRHGHIGGAVPLKHTYLDADPPALEYEFISGGDLAALTYQLHHDKAPLDASHRLIQRLAKTLAAFHKHTPPIVHRHLKPVNVLVQRREAGRVSLRVTDFDMTDDLAVDPHTDVFDLGILWCQMLLGDMAKVLPPDSVWRARLLGQGVPMPILDLLHECLDEDPARRPADAAVLVERLDPLLRLPAAVPSPSAATPPPPPAAPISGTPAVPSVPEPATAVPGEPVRSAAEWFAEGHRSREQRKYGAAVKAFDRAFAAGYDEAAVCRERSAAHIERHDHERAAADLNRLVAIRDKDIESYLLRGEFFLTVNRIDEAIADFTHAVQIDRQSARVYIGRGRACLAKGEIDLALACFDKAQRRDPRGTAAFRYRGDTWVLKGDLDKAFAEYTTALRLEPDNAKLYYARGVACMKQDRADQAMADFTEAVRLDYTFAPAHHRRGQVFLLVGELNDALMDFSQTIRLDRRHAAAYRDRAAVRIRLGKRRAALQDIDRSVKVARRDPLAYLERGRFHAHLGHHNKAIADFTRAVRLDEKYAEAYSFRGREFLAVGKLKHAVRDFTKLIALRPDSIEARLDRGKAYIAAKLYRRARADAREVLRRQPANAAALALKEEAESARKSK